MESEKVFSISFRSVFGAPRRERARRAVTLVREYVEKHLGTPVVKIGPALNETVWADGIQNIPKKVKIHVKVSDDKATATAELADVPFTLPEAEEKPKKEKADAKADAKAEKAQNVEKGQEKKSA